ncbi:MAG: tetratricopeptide repeat protein [Sulfurovum sp.]|nr:tetratricopeptide repeat protein [Sulfurovaceae bacterium]
MIFYTFFKKLFSDDFPKRGIDYEAKTDDAQIGGINRFDKTFSQPEIEPTRVEELISMADNSVKKEDLLDAKKALESALIIDENNIDVLIRYAYILNSINDFNGAKEYYQKVINQEPLNDMAYASLANIFHKLGDDKKAIEYHKKSIELDKDYAPHYFNYANTQYDRKEFEEAKKLYFKALQLDDKLQEAEDMMRKIYKE